MLENKKILVLGNGWLGTILKDKLNADAFGARLTDGYDIPAGIWNRYDIIINTIAKTNIDWCEKNKLETMNTNSIIAANLADRCKKTDKKYVFISSACIFESKNIKDIKYEDSDPNPKCWYSKTKAMAEELILEANPESLIVRPRLPISEVPHSRNTLNKLLSYNQLNSNQESVTIVEDFILLLIDLIEKNECGIFNTVNAGTISPAEIGELLGHTFKKVSKKSQDKRLANEGRAKRVTSYINSKRIPLLPDIRERIKTVIDQYKKYGSTVGTNTQ